MTDEFKLPEASEEAFVLPRPYDRIWKILWAVDPAHLRVLDRDIVINIVKENINYRFQVATAELALITAENEARAKMKQAELNALKNIQKMMR